MKSDKYTTIYKWIRIVAFVSLVLIIYKACDSSESSSRPYSPNKLDAYIAAQSYVTQNLKSPQSSDFPHISEITVTSSGNNKWLVDGYVDAVNSFNAEIREEYTCTVYYNPKSKSWGGNSLIFD